MQTDQPVKPQALRSPAAMRAVRPLKTAPEVVTLAIFLVASSVVRLGPYDTVLVTTALAFVIAGTGMNVLTGFVGLTSVGHAGFMALGAYSWALTVGSIGVAGAVLTVVGLTGLVAAIVGVFVLRFRSYYFALATLAVGFAATAAITAFPSLTGGSSGRGGFAALDFGLGVPRTVFILTGTVAVLILLLQNRLRHSGLGLQLLAMRGNPAAAASLGMARRRLELGAFVFSAVVVGVAGCLLAQISGFVSPSQFDFNQSVALLVIPIIGGRAWLWAPLVGTLVAEGIPDYARFLGSGRLVLYGVVLVLIAVFAPGGVRDIASRIGAIAKGVASHGNGPGVPAR